MRFNTIDILPAAQAALGPSPGGRRGQAFRVT